MSSFRPLGALLCVGMLLSGCGNFHSVYRSDTLPTAKATVITMDAKQRAILAGSLPLDTNGKPKADAVRRFCSEPSPDVFSVIAQSASATGSFGQSADPKAVEAALNAAFSSAENGSTIPRTQTVNMLRDLMFRTCERHLNDGYDSTDLKIQAIRDQRLMVSILAIEQLTGAVTPRPVVIGAGGSGTAGAGSEAIVRLDDARKAKEKAEAAYTEAAAAYERENGDDKVCDAIDGKPEDQLSDAQKNKVKPCKDVREAKDKALAERTLKTAAYTELGNLARSGGVSVATSLTSNAPGGLDRAHTEAVEKVTDAVRTIVERNFSDDSEVMMLCLKVINDGTATRNLDDAGKRSLQAMCVEYLGTTIKAAEKTRIVEAEKQLIGEMEMSRTSRLSAAEENFALFWQRQGPTLAGDASKRAALATQLKTRMDPADHAKADCFTSASDKAGLKACFLALTLPQQRELLFWNS